MSAHANIAFGKFPKQGSFLGRQVQVVFDYDTSRGYFGEVVRDDAEEPGRMIIRLSNGRYVLSTECQFSPIAGDGHVTSAANAATMDKRAIINDFWEWLSETHSDQWVIGVNIDVALSQYLDASSK